MKLTKTEKRIIENTKYQILVEYCKEMGSFPYYIVNEIINAEKENAPINAIYKKSNGKWETK